MHSNLVLYSNFPKFKLFMVKASMVEGKGPFVCTNESHKDEFKTNSLQEFNEHLAEKGHTLIGRMPCAICDKEVVLDDLQTGKKPVCDECKKELA